MLAIAYGRMCLDALCATMCYGILRHSLCCKLGPDIHAMAIAERRSAATEVTSGAPRLKMLRARIGYSVL